jgi:glycosyltransferase involved in cell wall biosynthesis
MLYGIAEGLQRSSDVALWIVGDGPLKADIEDLQQKYPDSVRYFGWVDYAEVPNYIIAADICIVPRHKSIFSDYYNEQGVQKIAEYLALGKPIVACNIAKSDNNYTLVDEDSIGEGILEMLARKTPLGESRYWEEHSEPVLIETINKLLSGSEGNSSSEILKYR